MHNKRLALVVAIVLTFTVGIAATVGGLVYARHAAQQAMVTRRVSAAHIMRTSAFAEHHIPPFDKTISDAGQAQRLYDALVALPVMPQGSYSCPADFGVEYHFTFFQRGAPVATASIDPNGCEGATLPDGSTRWAATDHGFWQALADVAGVPVAEIQPVPSP